MINAQRYIRTLRSNRLSMSQAAAFIKRKIHCQVHSGLFFEHYNLETFSYSVVTLTKELISSFSGKLFTNDMEFRIYKRHQIRRSLDTSYIISQLPQSEQVACTHYYNMS